MISVCPHCLSQVEHEDHLFEVICQCGTHFNPFDVPPIIEPAAESSAEGLGSSPAEIPANAFAESHAMFEEIREFGETLGASSIGAKQEGAPPKPTPKPSLPLVQPAADGEKILLTAGQGLEGFKIEAHLGVISSVAEMDLTSDSPLSSVIEKLSQQAAALGGNGILSVQWQLTPDGTKAIASGSAVRCLKCE